MRRVSCVNSRIELGMDAASATNQPDGKQLLFFASRVKPRNEKYFAFPESQIRTISTAIPSRSEGRIMIATNVGRVAVDAEVPIANGADAYGKDVWS